MERQLRHTYDVAKKQMVRENVNFDGVGMQAFGKERFFTPQRMPMGRDPRFKENLAFYLSDHELLKIGNELGDQIRDDDAARQKWLQINMSGIDQLGIGSDKSRPAGNRGSAGDIYAPTLLTTGLRVTCKLHAALFPASGFVETKINGNASQELDDQAMRIKEFFNYMTTDVMTEYKADKKQQLWWTVNFGSTFTKVFNDPMKGKPVADYIRPEDIIIDQNASALSHAERVTHQFILSEREMHLKYMHKVWKHLTIQDDDIFTGQVQQKIGAKIGVQANPTDKDKRYVFEECMTYLDLHDFPHLDRQGYPSGRKLPYIVVKAKESNNVVAIYRNWTELDPLFRPIEYLAQHKYLSLIHI